MYGWTCYLLCDFSKYAFHTFLLFFSLLVDQSERNLAKQAHANLRSKKPFFSPTIVWLNCDMSDLLIASIVHDKLNLLSLVYN